MVFLQPPGRDTGLLQVWKVEDIVLCSSRCALEGARINLGDEDQRTRHQAVAVASPV
jgi:hypothetical protein